MPIQVYKCNAGHMTERVKSIKATDAELEKDVCGTCNEAAELVVSKPARPILIGAGFHENDYHHGKLGS